MLLTTNARFLQFQQLMECTSMATVWRFPSRAVLRKVFIRLARRHYRSLSAAAGFQRFLAVRAKSRRSRLSSLKPRLPRFRYTIQNNKIRTRFNI